MTRTPVGELLRDWRTRRRRSQLDLSIEVGVSTRHLSFVETGRARPSPELVLAIAQHLDVPLRERNTLLLAAGYAPRFSQTSLDDPTMAQVRASIQRMLDAHHPYPGVAIDRRWDVVLANEAAQMLLDGMPAHLVGPPMNVYRLCLHPEGLAGRTLNFADWARYLVTQLHRSVVLTGDSGLDALLDEVTRYPNVAQVAPDIRMHDLDESPVLLVPLRLASPSGELSLFTTITTFGTPRDVTLDELAVELFFPSDERTAAMLAAAAGRPQRSST